MILVPQAFRDQPRWWHDEDGRRWLDAVPQVVEAHCRRWRLEPTGEMWHGSNALVVGVERAGSPLALRLTPPGAETAELADALTFWAGRGTVELVEADGASGALLLECLDGSHTLATEPVDVALNVVSGLLVRLAVPAPPGTRSTASVAREHVASFPDDWKRLDRPTPPALLDAAVASASRLADVDPGDRAVNGDLHDGQILRGSRAPWLVVDPVLLSGDPEYDLARFMWTRFDEQASEDVVLGAIDAVVEATGVPAARTRDWIIVRSMSYLLWGLSHGLTIDPPRCRRLLDVVTAY